MNATNVVIVAAKRTPMGGLLGALSEVSAPSLGSVAIAAAMQQAKLSPAAVDDVYMGNVISAGLRQAPARQASLAAGIPESVPCTTISKVCGSGMKAVMIGRDQIAAGNASVVIAGGMESMSGAPYLLTNARGGLRLGHGELKDSMMLDGLEDADSGGSMGSYGQSTADENSLTRKHMDDFAIRSLARANEAIANGGFEAEITPVTVTSRHGEHSVEVDEQPAKAKPEKIPHLRPAFKRDGTITAANSSSISDGAAAIVLMSESAAAAHQVEVLATLVGQASHAQAPQDFCSAPLGAIKKVLANVGWSANQVDLFEINEAFAVVPMLAMQEFGIPPERINVHGGACALGHPLGASGARIIVSLIYALRRVGKKRGIAALCIGGGEATAVAIELA